MGWDLGWIGFGVKPFRESLRGELCQEKEGLEDIWSSHQVFGKPIRRLDGLESPLLPRSIAWLSLLLYAIIIL